MSNKRFEIVYYVDGADTIHNERVLEVQGDTLEESWRNACHRHDPNLENGEIWVKSPLPELSAKRFHLNSHIVALAIHEGRPLVATSNQVFALGADNAFHAIEFREGV